jgi:hypothetical protein
MANLGTPLDTGGAFPALSMNLLHGGSVSLPENVGPGYGLVLLYRGSW